MKNEWSPEPRTTPGKPEDLRAQTEGPALFSLTEYRSNAANAAIEERSRGEISGVIDIRALMAEGEKGSSAEASPHVSPHIGVYLFGQVGDTPLPVETPAAVLSLLPASSTPARGRKPLRIGRSAGVAAGMLLGIAAMAATTVRTRDEMNEPMRAVHIALAPVGMLAASSPSSLPVTAQDEPSNVNEHARQPLQASDESASPESAGPAREPKVMPHVAKAPLINRTSEGPRVGQGKAKKSSANDACNGNLMCAMQRAVKPKKK